MVKYVTFFARCFFILLINVLPAPCGAAEEDVKADDPLSEEFFIEEDPRDPFEDINRSFWHLNYRYFDQYILRPTAVVYDFILPHVVQKRVYQFLLNLDEPVSFWNHILQWKWAGSFRSLGRFLVNSTLGIVGFFDVAESMGLERKHEDLAQTWGYWGIPNGPYLMVPALGAKVTRDVGAGAANIGLSLAAPILYFPFNYLQFWQVLSLAGLKNIHQRAVFIKTEALLESSLDPYIFVKEAYFQHLEYSLYDGEIPVDEDLFEYEDMVHYYIEENLTQPISN
jgi:phospholipid-binding lipoprotein MlaA